MATYFSQQDMLNIIGSWHREGFHGHKRSKSRTEFANSFRQNARPIPPEKFRLRLRDDALAHPFSKHDNKQIFLNDPTLFSNGIGKKKVDSANKSQWNPEFISWSIDAGKERSKKSIYQNDFCPRASTPNKLLSNRKNFDNNVISMYSSNFSHGEPKPETSKQIQSDNFNRYVSKQRAKTCVSNDRERLSVANCLIWHRPTVTHTDSNQVNVVAPLNI